MTSLSRLLGQPELTMASSLPPAAVPPPQHGLAPGLHTFVQMKGKLGGGGSFWLLGVSAARERERLALARVDKVALDSALCRAAWLASLWRFLCS